MGLFHSPSDNSVYFFLSFMFRVHWNITWEINPTENSKLSPKVEVTFSEPRKMKRLQNLIYLPEYFEFCGLHATAISYPVL